MTDPEEQGRDTEETMFFLLRVAFWLTIVLVLLPSGGSQPNAKSNIGASDALGAARAWGSVIRNFLCRQRNASVVGAQPSSSLGQRLPSRPRLAQPCLAH